MDFFLYWLAPFQTQSRNSCSSVYDIRPEYRSLALRTQREVSLSQGLKFFPASHNWLMNQLSQLYLMLYSITDGEYGSNIGFADP